MKDLVLYHGSQMIITKMQYGYGRALHCAVDNLI